MNRFLIGVAAIGVIFATSAYIGIEVSKSQLFGPSASERVINEVISTNEDFLEHSSRCKFFNVVIDRGYRNVTWICNGVIEMSHYPEH